MVSTESAVTSAQTSSAASSGGSFGTFGSFSSAFLNTNPDPIVAQPSSISAFTLMWDPEKRTHVMAKPLVVGPSGEISCTVPDSFTAGKTYFCIVVYDTESKEFSAEVTDSDEPSSSEGQTVMTTVELFTVPEYKDDGIPKPCQRHVGAVVVLPPVTLIGEIGGDSDSDPVTGVVTIQGASGSGLTVTTSSTEDGGTVNVDLEGRTDEFRICTFTDKNGNELAKFFGTADIDLSKKDDEGGNEGDEDEDEDGIEVVTGVNVYTDDLEGSASGKELKLKLEKTKILNVRTSSDISESDNDSQIVAFVPTDVVTGLEFESGSLTKTTAKVCIIDGGKYDEDSKTVFETTSHSGEHSADS